jgi:hypothetical protein
MTPDFSTRTQEHLRKRVRSPILTVMNASGNSVDRVVGRAMQRLRVQAGRRQEDVAAAACDHGLEWNRPTVAAFESGRRTLTAEQLLLFPAVYSRLLGREFRLAELFSEPVVVGSVQLTPQKAAQALCGAWKPLIITMRSDVAGEVEEKAARKLGFTVKEVSAAARRLWGHGLTYERDERLDEQALQWREDGLDPSPRTAQALRGHITRTLLAELKQQLERQQPEEGQ